MAEVAFIGLGVMGAPMARRLAGAGHRLRVYDVSTAARESFLTLPGCEVADSPAAAARGSDYLFTMLPESKHVRAVLFGEHGAAACLPPNALVVEMSTGDAAATLAIAEELAALGLRTVDAPVGRTPAEAEVGKLLIMAGGDDATIAELRPLLSCMGDEIVHAGPLGSGIRLKLVNNYMSMVSMVLTSETLVLARKLGLDREQVVRVLQGTVAGRGQINVNFPRKVLAGDVSPDFPLRLGLKDLSLALDLAKSAGAPMALGGAARELFSLAAPWGRAEQDCTAMLLLLEDIAHCKAEG